MRSRAPAWVLALSLSACEAEHECEEDIRAQVLAERVLVTVGEETVEAELADDPVERDRGWKHRRCDRDPCPEPCGGCPSVGEGLTVDAVLELPSDTLELTPGTSVAWSGP